jgi:hypothetical protein
MKHYTPHTHKKRASPKMGSLKKSPPPGGKEQTSIIQQKKPETA